MVVQDDQILAQMRKDPKSLGLEEMLHAGTLTTDLKRTA